jgi:LmbE family N-acetylglucosaminyl deacetylase
MKVLHVHAHYDDYEFTAAGTFELWRRKLGAAFQPKVLVCTDGKAGHHFRTREETGRIRLDEQLAAAKLGGYDFELLRVPDGRVPREACLQVTIELLAARRALHHTKACNPGRHAGGYQKGDQEEGAPEQAAAQSGQPNRRTAPGRTVHSGCSSGMNT